MSNLKNEIENVLFYRRLEDRLSEAFDYLEPNLLVIDKANIDYESLLIEALEYIGGVEYSMKCHRKDLRAMYDKR